LTYFFLNTPRTHIFFPQCKHAPQLTHCLVFKVLFQGARAATWEALNQAVARAVGKVSRQSVSLSVCQFAIQPVSQSIGESAP